MRVTLHPKFLLSSELNLCDKFGVRELTVCSYLGIYVGLTLVWVVNNLGKDVWYTLGTLRASKTIHRILTESILGTTLRSASCAVCCRYSD